MNAQDLLDEVEIDEQERADLNITKILKDLNDKGGKIK